MKRFMVVDHAARKAFIATRNEAEHYVGALYVTARGEFVRGWSVKGGFVEVSSYDSIHTSAHTGSVSVDFDTVAPLRRNVKVGG